MFALADVQKVGFIDKDEFERFSNTCMGFVVHRQTYSRNKKNIRIATLASKNAIAF